MKRFSIVGISAIAFIAISVQPPVIAAFQQAQSAITSKLKQPKLQVQLTAERQVIKGAVATWEPLKDAITVQPGDTIRYQLSGVNESDREIRNLVFTQPIPQKTVYVLRSAAVAESNDVKITYSIDQGKQFDEKPMVKVKQPDGKVELQPAPAEAYTHVRWKFNRAIAPGSPIRATYEVKVR